MVILGFQLVISVLSFILIVKHVRNKININVLNKKQLKAMISDMKQSGLVVNLHDLQKVIHIKVKLIDEKIHRKIKLNISLMYIIFAMSLFSVMGHVATIVFNFAVDKHSLLANNACFYSIFCIAVKCFFNFFAFSLLKKSFLNEFKGIIKHNF